MLRSATSQTGLSLVEFWAVTELIHMVWGGITLQKSVRRNVYCRPFCFVRLKFRVHDLLSVLVPGGRLAELGRDAGRLSA